MRTIELYIADDNTEFDNEVDCLEYELQCKFNKEKGTLIAFDACGEEITNPKDFEFADIIKIGDEKACEMMHKFYEFYGFIMPTQIGTFFWSDSMNDWMPYEYVEQQYEYFKALKNEMKNL